MSGRGGASIVASSSGSSSGTSGTSSSTGTGSPSPVRFTSNSLLELLHALLDGSRRLREQPRLLGRGSLVVNRFSDLSVGRLLLG